MAECHPVGFQWVVEAKARGAKVIHVDPRFSRTSALADRHVPLRTGTDIAWLGGADQPRPAAAATSSASTSSATPTPRRSSPRTSRTPTISTASSPASTPPPTPTTLELALRRDGAARRRPASRATRWRPSSRTARTGPRSRAASRRDEDETLEHPRCVFQVLKRHFSRYTPELVETVCGVPRAVFLEVADTICANSGRERTTAFVYSVGWTQRTAGSSTSGRRRSSSSCSGTSAGRAAGSSPSAGTRRSRGRPTSRPSTTSSRATSRCPRPIRSCRSSATSSRPPRPAASGGTRVNTSSRC